MATITNAAIGDVIKAVADAHKADVLLCEVTAWHESGFNAKEEGDDGSSFGLFQLHRGGELGNLTPAEAENPLVNCRVAIPTIAAVEHEHPKWTPGEVAAAAQRPANPAAYAATINQFYADVKAGKPPTGYLAARNAHTGLTIEDPDDGK